MKTFHTPCLGYQLSADWHQGQATDTILLSLIGWTSDKQRYEDILTSIVKNTGMSALVFEYSGHGNSPIDIATTTPAQHFLEVIHVFDWLKQTYPQATLNVMGTSYGGYMATQLTKYREFNKLILRAPAIYPPKDFYSLSVNIHNDWVRDLYRNDAAALAQHPLLARASNFQGQTLVMVHSEDKQVPSPTTEAYVKTFQAETYTAQGFPHGIGDMPRQQIVEYQTVISDWLNKV